MNQRIVITIISLSASLHACSSKLKVLTTAKTSVPANNSDPLTEDPKVEEQTNTDKDLLTESPITPTALSLLKSEFDSGLHKIGTSQDILIDFNVQMGSSGAGQITLMGLSSPFQFKSGAYPGEGGTCGNAIDKSCRMVLSFTPTTHGDFNQPLVLQYFDGTSIQQIPFNVSGRTYLIMGQRSARVNNAAHYGMDQGVKFTTDGTRLILTDRDNNRVLIYNRVPTTNAVAPDVALGQVDLETGSEQWRCASPPKATSMCWPQSAYSDGTRLYVADQYNYRILIWNTIPTSHGQAPDLVLGQTDFTSNTVIVPPTASSIKPSGIFSDGTHLWVSDAGSYRVLQWNSIPTQNNQPADIVLGQANFTAAVNPATPTASTIKNAFLPFFDGQNLFIPDRGFHRVLMWDHLPTMHNEPATLVIGQLAMTTKTINEGGLSASSLNDPASVYSTGTKLFISEVGNHRVLIFNNLPTSNKPSADIVLGQPDMVSNALNNGGPANAQTLALPFSVAVAGNKLIVGDFGNYRGLVWNTIPTANFTPADVVIGQHIFTEPIAGNHGFGISASTLSRPYSVQVAQGKVIVTDHGPTRTLIYNNEPETSYEPAAIALGNGGLNSMRITDDTVISSTSVGWNMDTHFDGTNLYVADTNARRVMVWSGIPGNSSIAANFVLGQNDFVADNYVITTGFATYINRVRSYQGKILIADANNNRILIWNQAPTSNGVAPDLVLGNTVFTNGTGGCGTTTAANKLCYPNGIAAYNDKLVVVDQYNNRVLIWNTFPTSNGASADVVLGQVDMTSKAPGCSASAMTKPAGVFYAGEKLYVTDMSNNRILVWNSLPIANNTPADAVIGQDDFTANFPNRGKHLDYDGVSAPNDIFITANRIYIADTGNSRIVVFPKD